MEITDNGKPKVIEELKRQLKDKTASDIIRAISGLYPGSTYFSTSLGLEDQIITQIIGTTCPDVHIFTLDTGRLFPEIYDLIDITEKRYKVKIRIFFPGHRSVQDMVNTRGINLFYESVENRKLCCHVRKIEPLKRALQNADVWISGLRRDQSVTRQEAGLVEWDQANQKIKVNPLIDWSYEEVRNYINKHDIPYNPLHDRGFPSIGCLPCTRAVEPGEDIRAGRWWWEHPQQKECGLHK